MSNRIHPFVFVTFGAVVALIVSFFSIQFGGKTALFLVSFLTMVIVGLIAGLNWRVYPWQVGLVGLVPALLFLFWRMYSSSEPQDIALNASLFVFLPVISLVAGSFGAYTGRWASHRSKRRSIAPEPQKPDEMH